MSKCNQRNKARLRELLATRARKAAPHERSSVQHVTGVLVQRGNLETRCVCFENKQGDKAFGKMFVRSATVNVSHAEREAKPITRSETPRSGNPIKHDIDVRLTEKVKPFAVDTISVEAWHNERELMVELSDRRWNEFILGARA